jgi:hypothetical protein
MPMRLTVLSALLVFLALKASQSPMTLRNRAVNLMLSSIDSWCDELVSSIDPVVRC